MGAQPASGAQPISFCHVGAQSSDPRHDVGHQVSVHPVDDAGVDISDLKQGWHLGFLAPQSTQITSTIRQSFPSSTITVMHGFTCRKTGSDLGAATALAWSTDIHSELVHMH